MEVGSIYSDLTTFWHTISPIVYLHVIGVLCWKFIGFELGLRDSILKFLGSEQYKKTDEILSAFEMKKLLPLLLLALAFMYLVIFRQLESIVSNLASYSYDPTYISTVYLSGDVILHVSEYLPATAEPSLGSVSTFAQTLEEVFSAQYASNYRSYVEWHNNKGRSGEGLALALIFLAVTLTIYIAGKASTIVRVRSDSSEKSAGVLGWCFDVTKGVRNGRLFIVGLAVVVFSGFAQHERESVIIEGELAKWHFVERHLQLDNREHGVLRRSDYKDTRCKVAISIVAKLAKQKPAFWLTNVISSRYWARGYNENRLVERECKEKLPVVPPEGQ